MKWIDVDERLPDNGKDVLVWWSLIENYTRAYYANGAWFYSDNPCHTLSFVSHWMPIYSPYQSMHYDTPTAQG